MTTQTLPLGRPPRGYLPCYAKFHRWQDGKATVVILLDDGPLMSLKALLFKGPRLVACTHYLRN